MELTLYNPYRRLTPSRRSRSNLLLDDIFGWPDLTDRVHYHTVDHWHPSVDISETDDTLLIRAEIPGLEKSDIKIEVEDNTLMLSGERKFEGDESDETYRSVERAHGKFFRSINLSENVNVEEIKATYRNGILEVRLPKAEESLPREIPVEMQ